MNLIDIEIYKGWDQHKERIIINRDEIAVIKPEQHYKDGYGFEDKDSAFLQLKTPEYSWYITKTSKENLIGKLG